MAASATRATAPARARRADPGARRELRRQIVRLGGALDDQRCSQWPRPSLGAARPRRVDAAGPKLLSLAELEVQRDDLVRALAAERHAFAQRALAEERARRRREEMLVHPAAHPGARVYNADVGEPGCGAVRCVPAAGLLGMLMGWWRVVISSGCP